MSRKRKHEEHVNHEAWAIPYGDLVTLLLAFFVVMYAMSSVNEGKYRVLSDSLAAAFAGAPKTLQPIQIGEKQVGSGADVKVSLVQQGILEGQPRSLLVRPPIAMGKDPKGGAQKGPRPGIDEERNLTGASEQAMAELAAVADDVEKAMSELIKDNLIVVRRHRSWVEVEIRTDILFPSGSAKLQPQAQIVIRQLAETLKQRPNPIRVEGHTDNLPINTTQFPSNWELSAGRSGSVVHLLTESGIDPSRLVVLGLGEYRPRATNDTPEGRNANRRVVLVIMATEAGAPEGDYAEDRGQPSVTSDPNALTQASVTDASGDAAPAPAFVTTPPAVEASIPTTITTVH
jgi:chemotaxis protein MotB